MNTNERRVSRISHRMRTASGMFLASIFSVFMWLLPGWLLQKNISKEYAEYTESFRVSCNLCSRSLFHRSGCLRGARIIYSWFVAPDVASSPLGNFFNTVSTTVLDPGNQLCAHEMEHSKDDPPIIDYGPLPHKITILLYVCWSMYGLSILSAMTCILVLTFVVLKSRRSVLARGATCSFLNAFLALFTFFVIVSFAERLIGTENSRRLRQRDKLLYRLQLCQPIDYVKAEQLLIPKLVYSISRQGTLVEDEVDRFSRQNLAFGLAQSQDHQCNVLAKRYFYGSTAAPTILEPSMLERLFLARLDAPPFLLEDWRAMFAAMQTPSMIATDFFPRLQYWREHIIDNVMTNVDGSVTVYWSYFRTDFVFKEIESGRERILLPKRHERVQNFGRMANWRALSGTALQK